MARAPTSSPRCTPSSSGSSPSGVARPYTPPAIDPPTYFNTGCCCFPDRDVTGLEIADGKVTLVRWLDDAGEARPKQLAPPIPLTELFARLRAAA